MESSKLEVVVIYTRTSLVGEENSRLEVVESDKQVVEENSKREVVESGK